MLLIAVDVAGNFIRFEMQVEMIAALSFAGIPDATLDEDQPIEDFVHLPDYVTAASGDPETFTYTIIGNTQPNCGVSIGNYTIKNKSAPVHLRVQMEIPYPA